MRRRHVQIRSHARLAADCCYGRSAAAMPDVRGETQSVNSDELDRELDQVLIGGRERREIVIVEYDESWPPRFEADEPVSTRRSVPARSASSTSVRRRSQG